MLQNIIAGIKEKKIEYLERVRNHQFKSVQLEAQSVPNRLKEFYGLLPNLEQISNELETKKKTSSQELTKEKKQWTTVLTIFKCEKKVF